MSRSTIRELSQNPEWAWYENYLHGARMKLLMLGMEYNDALDLINRNDTTFLKQKMSQLL